MNNGKWYIGTMNGGLFIIDRPPKPAPVDYLTAGDPDLKVIAAMGNDKVRAEAIVKAHNEVVEQLRKPMSFNEMKEWLSKQTQSADIETEADHKNMVARLENKGAPDELRTALQSKALSVMSMEMESEHPSGWLERKLEALLDRNSGLTDTQRLWALIYLTGEIAKELRIYQRIR